MSFRGMDVDQVEALAGVLDIQAKAIAGVMGVVDGAVSALSEVWHGDDLAMFHSSWHSSGRTRVQQASEQMSMWVTQLRDEVAQQQAASADGGPGWAQGGTFANALKRFSMPGAILAGISGTKLASAWTSFGGDLAETAKKAWAIEKLPGGKFLAPALKGVGLGFSLGDLGEAIKRGDHSGEVKSAIDAGMVVAAAPISALWTGLSTEVGFFLPLDSKGAGDLYDYMRNQRGMSPEQITKHWSGIGGFINYGNDNLAMKAPWLVKGADKLMEKPGEWLYKAEKWF